MANEWDLAVKMDLESVIGMRDGDIIKGAFLRHLQHTIPKNIRKSLYYGVKHDVEENLLMLHVKFEHKDITDTKQFILETPMYMKELKEIAEHVYAWCLLINPGKDYGDT